MYFSIYAFKYKKQTDTILCYVIAFPDFNSLLIPLWIQFWPFTVVPKYLHFVSL
jgi:hypothetical protein